MKAVAIVIAAVACLFGGTMAEDPVKVVFTRSKSSTGSTGGLLGCKPRSTSSSSGLKASIKFQAVRTGSVEYSRVRVPTERMTFSDVVVTDYGTQNFLGCVKAAKEKQMDAFSFENGHCVGFKIGNGTCPCTKGNFVIYLAKRAVRRPTSDKALIVAKERAAAETLPAGYVRKIIYPIVSMIGDSFVSSSSSCENVLADPSISPPVLLHTANGKCRYTYEFSLSPCNSCTGGNATEVIIKKDLGTQDYLLSKCGGTITPLFFTEADLLARSKPKVLYSHEGYGCIPYTDPASDNNCDITVIGPAGTVTLLVVAQSGSIDIDGSAGSTCDGDELYVYDGPADSSPCKKSSDISVPIYGTSGKMSIRFQRKPANNINSVNRGFALSVYASNIAMAR